MLSAGDQAPPFAVKTSDGGYWFSEEAGQRLVVSFAPELDEHLRDAAEQLGLVWIVDRPREPLPGVTVIVDDG